MQINSTSVPWNKKKSQGRVYKNSSTFDYTNSKWRALRAEKLRISPYCECEECKGKKVPARVVDHIQPITLNGNPYDINNLQSMTDRCHNIKRANEKNQKYSKGKV